MGSQNSDGSAITQKRNSIKKFGHGYTDSADRVETATSVNASGILGPQIDSGVAQFAAQRMSSGVKITRADTDTKISFVAVSGLADL